ncbi:inositol polyphosphate-4-phosphatase type I A isoform X2 [Drosophila navojoa]|uniref:inositol polyphosphate-4-phosphatase type I A isoform X2 n=1 Tax=Drosophila navojoa TaxID=7232 RepID=UPI0011BDE14F|nr:inositol polyphosphate-4-phosphatase type I A isoform X2 [Drosophila navojoa]
MRFNTSELASLATNSLTRFDKEGLLILTERQSIFWRTDDPELSELPICETAISCDSLPLDSFGRAPNPRVVCSVLQPGEDYLWTQHARTELLERTRAPSFLCTMRFLRSAGFQASSRLRFTVYDVRERVSLTSLPLGHAEVALGVIQDTTRLRLPLCSPSGECGSITLTSWAPEAATELASASGLDRAVNGLTQPTQPTQPPRSSTQFFQQATEGSARPKGHRRTQSLPPKLGVRLFVPQQCGVGHVCVNPLQHSYRLQSSLGADISVLETLLESRLCCAVPQQLLSIWIQREKELLQEISGMGELNGEWRWRQMNLLEEHLRLLKDYSQAKQNIQQLMRDGVYYKRSAVKTDESLEFLPVNLHVQRMWAQNDALHRRGVLDIVTVGAFTRHDAKGRKCGGLIKLLQESKAWKLEQSNACKVQAANDAVQATKQLRKEIVELMSQLLQLATQRSARDMMPLCNEMINKTQTLLNIWEPSIVEEAVTFIERHRIIEEPDNEPMSPFRKITQQLSALELKSPELEDFATPVVAPPDLWPRGGQPLMRSNSWHPSNSSPSSSLDINAIDSLQHVVKCYNAHLRSLEQQQQQGEPAAAAAVPPQPQCELSDEATYQSLPPSWEGVAGGSSTAPVQLIDLDEMVRAVRKRPQTASFLDTKLMSSSPSANYYRPTEEPEPLDLTQLNIEASVMCLVSKLKFFCGRSDSPAIRLRHPKVPLKREGFAVAPQQTPDVIAAPDVIVEPTQQLKLDLAPGPLPAPSTASASASSSAPAPPKKGNKFTDGLDLSLTTDWVGELRPSMRKLRHAMDRLLKTARLMHSVQRLQQDVRCNRLQASIMYRRDVCFSQALTALVSALMVRLWGREVDVAYISLLRELGPLAYFEGLLSLYGSETDMWSDMCIAIEDLSAVSFTLVSAGQDEVQPMPRITGSRQALEVLLPVPEHALPANGRSSLSFKITPVFFNIGINEKATLGQTREQQRSNLDNYLRLSQYFSRYRKLGLNATCAADADASVSEWDALQSLLGYMEQQLRSTVSKNVKVLHLAEDACRLMGGLRFTSCKSAKDRTGMAVTLEQCRVLVREFQLPAKQVPYVLSTMRSEGTRMDNVFKNIGKHKYAFNLPQVIMLPAMYRPPVGAYGKAQT